MLKRFVLSTGVEPEPLITEPTPLVWNGEKNHSIPKKEDEKGLSYGTKTGGELGRKLACSNDLFWIRLLQSSVEICDSTIIFL